MTASLQQLRNALRVVAEEQVDLAELTQLRSEFDAVVAAQLGRFDASNDWAADGSKSAAGWMVKHCRRSVNGARADVKIARQVREMPLVEDAWRRGEITTEHVEVLARTRHRADANERFAAFETAFVDVARTGLPEDVANVARQWRDALDADRQDIDSLAGEQHEARGLDMAELLDGMTVLDGSGDAESAARVRRAIAIAHEKLHKKHDARTPRQQRWDALVMVCDHYTNCHAAPSSGRNLVVFTDAATFNGEAVGLCETDRGARISPATMRRFACDSSISVAAVNERSEVLALSRAVRTFTPAQRKAIIAQYPTCVGVGCRVPAAESEMHHTHWWEHGGSTDTTNGLPLCGHEHFLVHEVGWRVERDRTTGIVSWWKPDGTYGGETHPRRRPEPIPVGRGSAAA